MAQADLLGWLERLHGLGLVRLSPFLVEACARVVAMQGVWRDREDLADALASLLASDERTFRAIREHFLRGHVVGDPLPPARALPEAAPTPAPPPVVVEARPTPRWLVDSNLGGRTWGGLLAVAVVVGVFLLPSSVKLLGESLLPPDEVEPAASTTGGEADEQDNETSAETTLSVLSQVFEEKLPTPTYAIGKIAEAVHEEFEVPSPAESDVLAGPAWLRWFLLLASPVLAFFAGRWWAASTQLREDIDRVEAEATRARDEAQAGGRVLGSPYDIARELWHDRGKVDDAATILARRRHGALGDDLDVPPTLERTIDAGGRLSPVFAPAERRAIPIVLVDAERTGHPYLSAVDVLLERWRTVGLVFERYDFDFDPSDLTAQPMRQVTLDELARRSEGRPLLVFSRFRLPEDYHGALAWPRLLGAWPARAWIDLDPRTLAEHDEADRTLRQELARHLPRFAFTAEDLVRAARNVTTGEPVQPAPARALPPVEAVADELWKWAACAALVPNPSWPQLEAVRRNLAPLREALADPRLVQRLIEWAGEEELAIAGKRYLLGSGPRLAFDPLRRRGLLARLRRHDEQRAARGEPRLEWLARELLIRQLEAAKLADDPFGEALRLAKIAFHRAVMHPEQARELLAEHSDGAASRELKELALEELALQASGAQLVEGWSPAVTHGIELWVHGGPAARFGDLFRLGIRVPRALLRALPWALAGCLGGVLWWGEEAGRWDMLPGSDAPAQEVTVRVVTTPATWEVVMFDSEEDVPYAVPETATESPGVTVEMPVGSPAQSVKSGGLRRVQPQSSPGPYVPAVDRAHVKFMGLLRAGCQKIDSDPAGALKALQYAVQAYTGGRHFDLYVCLGRAHAAAGDHASSLVWYREAMLMSPTNRTVMERFVAESILAGKRAGALSFLRGQRYKNPSNKVLSDYLDELNRQNDDSVLLPVKTGVGAAGSAPAQR